MFLFYYYYYYCVYVIYIEPDNILLFDKASNMLKLSDFGISRESTSTKNCQTIIGTPLYQAPEVSLSNSTDGYDGKKADFWSVGIILYIMLIAAPPAVKPSEIHEMADKRALLWYEEKISDSAKDLIYRLLTIDPKKRITAQEIKKHPWMLGFDTMNQISNNNNNNNNDIDEDDDMKQNSNSKNTITPSISSSFDNNANNNNNNNVTDESNESKAADMSVDSNNNNNNNNEVRNRKRKFSEDNDNLNDESEAPPKKKHKPSNTK